MDTLEKLQYIRERIIETEKESLNHIEEDIYNVDRLQKAIRDLQDDYVGCKKTATHAG